MPTSSDRAFQTHIAIDQNLRRTVIDGLNQRLADTLDLYTQVKQAHWNVKGMDFFQLHELFDKLAGEVLPFVDMIAERVTTLGGYATGTARMAASSSQLPEFPRDAVDGRQMLDAVIDRYSRYIASTRKAIDDTEDEPNTQDLLIEIGREVEKHLYLLESHVQSAVQRAG